MTALRIELRRSPALLLLPVMLGLGAQAAWRELSPWVFTWQNAGSAVVMSTIFMGPLSAGAGAWAGGRERRRDTGYLHELGGRTRLAGPAVALAAVSFWTLFAYVGVAVAVAARTVNGDGWGRPDLLWMSVGGLGLLLHPVLGYLVGRALPKRLTPPLVVVVCYLLEWFGTVNAGRSGWWAYLIPAGQIPQSVSEMSSWRFSLGQGLWYTGGTAAALTIWAVRTGGPARLGASLTAGGASLVALVTGVLLVAGHPSPYAGAARFQYVCQGHAPVICVHPAYQHSLGPVRKGLRPLFTRLTGTPFQVNRLEQRMGLGSPPPGTDLLDLNDLYAETYVAMAAEQLALRLTMENCFGGSADARNLRRSGAYQGLVQAWLTGGDVRGAPVPQGQAAQARDWFAGRTEPQRTRWLTAHADEVRSCTLDAADFQ